MAKKKELANADTSNAIHIGISESDRLAIAQSLGKLLADSYSLFLMTHNFHWNVTGPQFNSLHMMFETQYTELFTAVDEIAKRKRRDVPPRFDQPRRANPRNQPTHNRQNGQPSQQGFYSGGIRFF